MFVENIRENSTSQSVRKITRESKKIKYQSTKSLSKPNKKCSNIIYYPALPVKLIEVKERDN